MDEAPDRNGDEAPQVGLPDLVSLCRLLNEGGVRYLVYGGLSCLLHGHERMTRDADIYLGESRENIARALAVLKQWGDGYAGELTVDDVLENVVVRVCDAFVLDLACRVWNLDWDAAWHNRRVAEIDGVGIPFLSRADLIQSKRTYREKDHVDLEVLRSLTGPEPGRPVESNSNEPNNQ